MHMCVCLCLWKPEKGCGGVRSFGDEVAGGRSDLIGHLEPYTSPLGEQQVLLMAELALHPFVFQFKP